ncbi:alginate O-acetyltransferase AlgX-related protein [Clostridium chromiireducens]|uniref:alginate O-acetyltransferase AlgX-related protein n=1 Tax=Clostridium chromiireducens TaxID=225345 RepID=UPI003AF5BCE9
MNKLMKINIIFILCFIAMIVAPLLFSNRVSNKMSSAENRYLASFPKLLDEKTGNVNRNFPSGFNSWLKDNIGFRDFFVKMNADIDYRILKTSPSPLVKIGREGWFFYNNDNNIEIASGNYPLNKETLVAIKNEQESIQKALEKKGIEYVLVLTPSKVSIYPEKIEGGNFKVMETPIDIVEEYLKENTTIKVINTKDVLLNAKENGEQVFNKTDTHWNEEGAYIGYKKVINELNSWGVLKSSEVKVNKIQSTYKGEFSSMMGNVSLLPPEYINATEIVSPNAVTVENDELMNLIQTEQQYDNFGHGGNRIYKNLSQQGKNVLMYGDSFFGGWKLPDLFAENSSDFTYVWSDRIKGSIVDKIKPNVVIFERTERYITTLAKQADPVLLYGKLDNPSAKIISHNTPNEIKRGEKYDINVTVKNTTNEAWSSKRNIKLCIWQDGQDYGFRVNLPENFELKPNEEYTFTLKDFQASPNNSTYLEYQMVEEGIAYFGEKKRTDIIVKD